MAESRIEEDLGRGMVEFIGVHRAKNTDIVDDTGQMRNHLRQFGTTLSVSGERETRAEHSGIGADKGVSLVANNRRRQRLALQFFQQGLVVE